MREVVGFLLALFVVPSLVVGTLVYLLVYFDRGLNPVVMGLVYVVVAVLGLFGLVRWRSRRG